MNDLAPQLVERVRAASADRTPLCIVGGGSKAGMLGRTTAGARLDIGSHSGIVSYQPGELVLTARAGTRLAEIETVLAERGQALSFEPPHFGPGATLGGTLACNLSGPARPWSGAMRDMVLGVRLINGKGEHLRFGGQVMKNVAGYDLSRLQAGAMGTLGVVTEISLKVLPRPRASLTLVEEMDEGAAILKMNQLAGRPWPLTGAAWTDGRLHLRLAGEPEAITAARVGLEPAEIGEEGFWTELREQRLAFFQGEVPVWRLSVPSARPPLRPGAATLIDWGGALRWSRGGEPEDMQSLAGRAGGHAILFRGGDRAGEIRQRLPAPLRALHSRLKAAFDPAGILNPGCLYGWM